MLIDYYYASVNDYTSMRAGINELSGQAITLSKTYKIKYIAFVFRRYYYATGNVYAKIYAATGTVGTNAYPTGSVLATSEAIDITTVSDSKSKVTFTFTTPYTITAGNYCVCLNYAGGDASNHLLIYFNTTSASHYGNMFYAAVNPISTWDCYFYLYDIYKKRIILI